MKETECEKYEITKCCAYCERSTQLANEEYVLCTKKGVVSQSYLCRRFLYDPMKRRPKKTPPLPVPDESEFIDV